jgi:hypothetical protein
MEALTNFIAWVVAVLVAFIFLGAAVALSVALLIGG